jgi:hypothetical protein
MRVTIRSVEGAAVAGGTQRDGDVGVPAVVGIEVTGEPPQVARLR